MTIKVQEITSETPFGIMNYAASKPNAELIGSSLFSDPKDLRACSKEMHARMKLGRGKVKMLHLIISEHPNDNLKIEQDREIIGAIVHEYYRSSDRSEAMPSEHNALYMAIKHRDRRHGHDHLFLPVVGADGKMLNRKMERVRLRKLARSFEEKWGITATPLFSEQPSHFTKPEIEKGHRLCTEGKKMTPCPERMDLRATLQAVIPAASSFAEMETLLSEQGITVHYRLDEAGQRSGISFAHGPVRITGKNAGFNFSNLKQLYGNEDNHDKRITNNRRLAPTSPIVGESDRQGIGADDSERSRPSKRVAVRAKHSLGNHRQATRPEYQNDSGLLATTQSILNQLTGARPREDPLLTLLSMVFGQLAGVCDQSDRGIRRGRPPTINL